ncbi:MAG: tRNA lysidine(34) synthetase TilS [Candidatus Marinimicrobia bacterium]|nr:tRNA lysidine(34) synthetase TilS [Candidatus Neomarinimicrobiota bacterium]
MVARPIRGGRQLLATYHPDLLEPAFRSWDIPLDGGRFLVAFSGGLDSTVLAGSMSLLAQSHGLALALGHVNHRLRPNADEDEAFCREFAAGLGRPCLTATLDPSELKGESLEAWARRERYAALERMRQEVGADWILTAHHADDQAETVLMRLTQQAPFITLAGIRPRRGHVLRPLLSFTKEALGAWALRQGLAWREDPTNADPRFLRNRLRHGVMATLVREDDAARESLLGIAQLAQRYETACSEVADELVHLATPGAVPRTVSWPVEPLLAADSDVFKLAVGKLVDREWELTIRLSTPFWQNFRQFVRKSVGGKVFELTKGIKALKDRGRIILYQVEQVRPPARKALEGGNISWGRHVFQVRRVTSRRPATRLWLRPWRAGDRAPAAPGRRPKLVSDIFIDAQLSRLDKDLWPLIVSSRDQVIWVPGLSRPRQHWQRGDWSIEWRTQNPRN